MTANPVADHWLESPLGAAVFALETRLLQDELADVVGFELLQIGCWGDPARLCAAARTQHRSYIAPDATGSGAIRAHFDALPIATNSVEAVLLPHTLEHAPRPHELLREVDRVLVGEGNLVICAFNPWSTWGVRHHFASSGQFPPHAARMMSEHRTRDWLSLLGFEVVSTRRYLFAPDSQGGSDGNDSLYCAQRPHHRSAHETPTPGPAMRRKPQAPHVAKAILDNGPPLPPHR